MTEALQTQDCSYTQSLSRVLERKPWMFSFASMVSRSMTTKPETAPVTIPKRIAEYVGNSPEVIYRSYGKWLGRTDGFGNAAIFGGKTETFPETLRDA